MKEKNIINTAMLLSLIIITLSLNSCRKSNLSPFCWGECEEAVLYYDFNNECRSINGKVILKNDSSMYIFQNSIPKTFHREEPVYVCIKYRYLGIAHGILPPCPDLDLIKINCIQEK
ncbi:MAG: hypothetical protein EA412_12585 [Chitinophagaceae bacterium]|nr:MAG: hypothetical protein EA412_12585 [Chitinophagaceae bacterium]